MIKQPTNKQLTRILALQYIALPFAGAFLAEEGVNWAAAGILALAVGLSIHAVWGFCWGALAYLREAK